MEANRIRLHLVRAGTGPPVVLLHGFPEFWYSWRHQLAALANAGFDAYAPDLRGYNLSDKPAGRASYRLEVLVEDIAALVRHTGQPRAHVVGHDWGGVIAWAFASRYPALLDKLVLINAPHLARYRAQLRNPRQLRRSWYVLLFQIPELAELVLSARNYAAIRSLFTSTRRLRERLAPADVDRYVAAIARRGALTAALNYYRAMRLPQPRELTRDARTAAETLVIWGERDQALTSGLLDGLERYAPRLRIHRMPEVSHWVQNEAPDETSSLLIDFLR